MEHKWLPENDSIYPDQEDGKQGYLWKCQRCGVVANGPYQIEHPVQMQYWLSRYDNKHVLPDCDVQVVRGVLDP